MEVADEERSLLHHSAPQDAGSEYTSDGSVDINKQPALKQSTGKWRACFLILGGEFSECVAFLAIAKNLVRYLTGALHESNVDAARNVSAWVGFCFLTPLLGAFLADTYWGRYRTIVTFLSVYTAGLFVLTVSASLPLFLQSSHRRDIQSAAVYLGLYLVAFGTGGIKPCTSAFGADQFDSADPVEWVKKGSFFNWYYFAISIGSLFSGTVLIWVQDNIGWSVGFAIPMVLMVVGLTVFVTGSRVYRFKKLGGSPLTRLSQVVVSAVRKWHLELPNDTSLLYESSTTETYHKIQHTNQFRFFDKAAMVLPPSSQRCAAAAQLSPWRLCTVTQVEEFKILLRISPVWASLVVYSAVVNQLSSTFIEQATVMDNYVGSFAIPPASLSTISVISTLVGVPIYVTVLVPLARRVTGRDLGFSQLQRLGIGLTLSMLTMVYAALLEMKRLDVARASGLIHRRVPVPLSILWQAPLYFMLGMAEVFGSIGMIEFFYNQSPRAMESLSLALGQLVVATGSYLNSLLLGVVGAVTQLGGATGWIPDNLNEGHLDYFFWLMAFLSALNLMQFVHYSMRYRGTLAY